MQKVLDKMFKDTGHENIQMPMFIPESLLNWVTTPYCEKNAYEEFCKWEKVIIKSFGKRRFVEMDVSID